MEAKIIFEVVLNFVSVLIMAYFSIKSCSVLTGFKPKINICSIIVTILLCSFQYINAIYNYSFTKPVFALIIMFLINLIIYRKKTMEIFISTFAFYIIILISEIIFTLLLINKIQGLYMFDHYRILIFLFTILISLSSMLLIRLYTKLKKVYKFNYYENPKIILFIMVLLFVLFCEIMYKYTFEFSSKDYLVNLLILITILTFMFLAMVQYIKFKRAEEKELVLLEFMKEYEKIIDKDRIDRHEMLNNLLLIKSLNKSEDKRFIETINGIIKIYDNNSNNSISKLFNLPSGLKGLIYYKLYNLQLNKIKPEIYISKKVISKIDCLENNIYLKIYKILGILLDNAVESCISSKDHILILDIYEDNEKIYFYIENSTSGNIEIKNITKKGYSTKGNNRGFGLYVVNSIIGKGKGINLQQRISKNNRFISILNIDHK